MTFAQDIINDLEDFYVNSGFAVDITHTTLAGATSDLLGLVKHGRPDTYHGADDYGVDAEIRIQAQGTYGITTIEADETITIGTGTWVVIDARKAASGLEWICSISKKS